MLNCFCSWPAQGTIQRFPSCSLPPTRLVEQTEEMTTYAASARTPDGAFSAATSAFLRAWAATSSGFAPDLAAFIMSTNWLKQMSASWGPGAASGWYWMPIACNRQAWGSKKDYNTKPLAEPGVIQAKFHGEWSSGDCRVGHQAHTGKPVWA